MRILVVMLAASATAMMSCAKPIVITPSPPVTVQPPPPPPPPKSCSELGGSKGPNDGRFTIGAGAKRLMYGYPIPHSTSHFVLVVNSYHATNNPGFFYNSAGDIREPGRTTRYISGTIEEQGGGDNGSLHTKITYEFHGVRVTQRLVPVSAAFKDVALGRYGQHYRIEYELVNDCGLPVDVGLLLQIDTMIDNNDACRMQVRGQDVSTQTAFAGTTVPSTILVFRNPGEPHGLTGVFTLDKGMANPPDELYIGKWPRFYKALWEVPIPRRSPYGDSSVILKWRPSRLEPGQKRYVATHYGVQNRQRVRLLHTANTTKDRLTVYFRSGSAGLAGRWKREIDSFLSRNAQDGKILGAVVQGYADAAHNHAYNLKLSMRRAMALRRYLSSKRRSTRIPKSGIIPKAFGETRADQSSESQRKGLLADRKGEIILYVVPH